MSKLITLDQLKTFATNIKAYISGKSKTVNDKTFSMKLQLPCYCTVVGKSKSGNNILNSIICIDDSCNGIVINSGKIQINKISNSDNTFQIECSESVYYVISSSELTDNPSSSTELTSISFVDNTTSESDPVEYNVSFSIKDSDNYDISYPSMDQFDSIYKAGRLSHRIQFKLADTGVDQDGYDLSEDEVLIQSSVDSTVASKDTLGKIKVDGEFSGDATKLPVKLEDNYAYVTLPTSIFTYKGSVNNYDSLPTDAKEGDVYTVKSGGDNEDTGSEYIRVKKDDKYYWEYLGQKVTFEQIQADWNVTDTTNKAYIKNKPVKQQLFKRKKLAADETLTLVSVFDITDGNNTPTVPIECEMLFYNSADSEVTVTPDSKWINMQSSDETITIPTGKYAEYVFTYWPKDGDEAAVVTYNGAVQP